MSAASKKKHTVKPTQNAHRFIVLEGPIGVGKTSLATRVARRYSGRTTVLAESIGSTMRGYAPRRGRRGNVIRSNPQALHGLPRPRPIKLRESRLSRTTRWYA